ncbi:MAG: TPM domain-containing protein [Ignavibacteriae bacterium]|nr:TPM domain-containing protein [Ignavibacteriota bacterium]
MNTRTRAFTALLLALSLALVAYSKEVHYLSSRVNDYAGILSPECIQRLEQTLKSHEDSTSNQVVVLTVESLEGEVLEEYSIKVVDQWKLGTKKNDNGVLLLIAKDDRKVRIEVGNGLEGSLTDLISGAIIRHEIVPAFKDGDYDGGVEHGVDAILKAIKNEYQVELEATDDEQEIPWEIMLIVSGIFLVVVGTFTTIALLSQGAGSWFLYAFLTPFWLAFPPAIYGARAGLSIYGVFALGFPLAKYLFAHTVKGKRFYQKYSKNFVGRGGRSGSSWGSSSGSSWSSSSSSSSSSFSGGGGSFSGGGSSGSW